MGRSAFHRCCIEQNPRILKMLVDKLEHAHDKDTDLEKNKNKKTSFL